MNRPEDEGIVRYLLGNLEDSEAERIEERYFRESSFEEHVGAVEDSLIADFLNGTLSTGDVKLFEKKYLGVPELQDKVAFARRLRAAAAEHKVGSQPIGAKHWAHWAAIGSPVFAAVGLVCLAASWMVVHTGYDSSKTKVLLPKNAETRSAPASLKPLPGTPAMSVVLLPGVTKGADTKPVRLLLTPDIKEIRLELDVPGVHEELMARVEILLVQSESRKLVWSSDRIPSASTVPGRTVLVSINPEDLTSGDYIAYVKDSSRGAESEPLQSYVFGVVRP